MDFLTILLIIACIIGFWIFCEKVLHPEYSLAECTRKFKADLGSIISILFSGDPVRHVFDASLWENFLVILGEYSHDAFSPAYQAEFYDGTPRLRINFVPSRTLNAEELSRLSKLLCLKLNQYLQLYGLCWKVFGEYHILDGTATIVIYYAEFKEDVQPFLKRYRIAVKHKATNDNGVLHDEALDKEINNARPKH